MKENAELINIYCGRVWGYFFLERIVYDAFQGFNSIHVYDLTLYIP